MVSQLEPRQDIQLMRLDLRTPICAELNIQYPIFSVGFGAAAGPELAAAVSNAGAFGVLGATGIPADEIELRIASTRRLTDRRRLIGRCATRRWKNGRRPDSRQVDRGPAKAHQSEGAGSVTAIGRTGPRYAVGTVPPDFEGDIEYAPLWAGESCSVVNDIKPAAEIVRDLVGDAEAALARSGT
jgi:NAD(P)H-dependent flavin oxidoreductase YrpB (nitropropane dioxygenase family)